VTREVEVLWPRKCENFRSGIRQTTIYGNFLVIAEKCTVGKMNTCGDARHGPNTYSKYCSILKRTYVATNYRLRERSWSSSPCIAPMSTPCFTARLLIFPAPLRTILTEDVFCRSALKVMSPKHLIDEPRPWGTQILNHRFPPLINFFLYGSLR
jgi:hypothetical protein